MTGHPGGTEWFCGRHYRAAKALQDRPLSDALAVLGRRRWLGALRWVGLAIVILLAGTTAWNTIGPVELVDVDNGYVGRVYEGRFRDQRIDHEGALLAARWVGTRTRPSWNPLRILWQQLWYNAWTEGYDQVLWLEPETWDSTRRHYALYQAGRTVFLRIEHEGRNRVLDASFSAEDLERAFEPFVIGARRELPPEAPPGRD